jgi:hypothetical protein
MPAESLDSAAGIVPFIDNIPLLPDKSILEKKIELFLVI